MSFGPPNGGWVRENPLFQGNLGWWNIMIWPDGYDVMPGGTIDASEILQAPVNR